MHRRSNPTKGTNLQTLQSLYLCLSFNTEMQDLAQSLSEQGITCIPTPYIRPLEERPKIAHNAFSNHKINNIPIIDLCQPHRKNLIEEISQACELYGFFQIINHGIPKEILEKVIELGSLFFALPSHEKVVFACREGVVASEGYGHKMLVQENQILDWRDYFDHHTLPLSRRNTENCLNNPPAYRRMIEEYNEQMKLLAKRLLSLISESLGLKSSYIQEAIGEPYQNISLKMHHSAAVLGL